MPNFTLAQGQIGQSRYGDGLVAPTFTHSAKMGITYVIGSVAGTISTTGLVAIFGQPRYGDELGISLLPRVNAMGLSYIIVASKYAVPMGLTYTIQRPHTAPMLIYYLIVPPSNFTINGDGSIINPDQMNYGPRPVVARSLLATPIEQGLDAVTWSWAILSWPEYKQIVSHYNPVSPIVTIGYIGEDGNWAQRQAVMHPPTYGHMETMLFYDTSILFSILL
jgi:hypothetical protein